ncbi:MAG: hypothetical protein KF916_01980 [Microbacteriaceae bacterium]|nr:hypothetical protein [Microbacteriaceae bacterium]
MGKSSERGSIVAEYLITFPALIAVIGLGLTVITADIVVTKKSISSLEHTYRSSLGVGIHYQWFCEEFCVPSRW